MVIVPNLGPINFTSLDQLLQHDLFFMRDSLNFIIDMPCLLGHKSFIGRKGPVDTCDKECFTFLHDGSAG